MTVYREAPEQERADASRPPIRIPWLLLAHALGWGGILAIFAPSMLAAMIFHGVTDRVPMWSCWGMVFGLAVSMTGATIRLTLEGLKP